MTTPIQTLSVSEAVMRMDLAHQNALMFRNASHGELNLVYRRPDGNVGWVDPGLTLRSSGGMKKPANTSKAEGSDKDSGKDKSQTESRRETGRQVEGQAETEGRRKTGRQIQDQAEAEGRAEEQAEGQGQKTRLSALKVLRSPAPQGRGFFYLMAVILSVAKDPCPHKHDRDPSLRSG